MNGALDYSLPNPMQVSPLPWSLFNDAQEALLEIIATNQAGRREATIAYACEGPDSLYYETFGKKREGDTSRRREDLIVQLTVRVPHPSNVSSPLPLLAALEVKASEYHQVAQRAKLEEEIAQAEADAEKADAVLKNKRDELEAFNRSV